MAAITEMTDWLGNTVTIGDYIIYGAASGRSITMVIAEVLKFHDSGSITVQPIKSSRWKQHNSSHYIDSRTGKRINGYADKHIARESYMKHKVTGEELSLEEYHRRYHTSNYAPTFRDDYDYINYTYKDYVKLVNGVNPVVLQVTENVTKWQGDISDIDDVYDGTV